MSRLVRPIPLVHSARFTSQQPDALQADSDPPKPLTPDQLKDILIELSSPLTGYLGRQKGEDGSDRFYYLRDLPVKLD